MAATESSLHELTADEIFRPNQSEMTLGEHALTDLNIDRIFAEAAEFHGDNPLTASLVGALRVVRVLTGERDIARSEARAERVLRQQAVHELSRVSAQLEAARRTIAALRAQERNR